MITTIGKLSPKLGDTVSVFVGSDNTLRRQYTNSVAQISADIVGIYHNRSIEYLLGWKKGSICPAWATGRTPIAGTHYKYVVSVHNYYCSRWITDDYEVDITSAAMNQIVITTSIKELPCVNTTCGKMNDFGAKLCWWCQSSQSK